MSSEGGGVTRRLQLAMNSGGGRCDSVAGCEQRGRGCDSVAAAGREQRGRGV